jgi:hypothetical protein
MLLDLLNKNASPPIKAIGNIRLPRIPQLEFPSTLGCASISTLAFLNFVINSGAVAGNSTLILCILFPNSGPIAYTIAVCPSSYKSTLLTQPMSKYSKKRP